MTRTCPNCSKPAVKDSAAFPFCSDRCKTLDLGSWISGDYRIPATRPEDAHLADAGLSDGREE